MTFDEASAFVMPIGQHRGRTMDDVAQTDKGLIYLDWLRGERATGIAPLDHALAAYLDQPSIAKDLAALVKGQG